MHIGHILFVYNDGIRGAKDENANINEYVKAIGEAVLKVCLDPVYESTPEGLERRTNHSVLNHGNCINWVEEIHSSETAISEIGVNDEQVGNYPARSL